MLTSDEIFRKSSEFQLIQAKNEFEEANFDVLDTFVDEVIFGKTKEQKW